MNTQPVSFLFMWKTHILCMPYKTLPFCQKKKHCQLLMWPLVSWELNSHQKLRILKCYQMVVCFSQPTGMDSNYTSPNHFPKSFKPFYKRIPQKMRKNNFLGDTGNRPLLSNQKIRTLGLLHSWYSQAHYVHSCEPGIVSYF